MEKNSRYHSQCLKPFTQQDCQLSTDCGLPNPPDSAKQQTLPGFVINFFLGYSKQARKLRKDYLLPKRLYTSKLVSLIDQRCVLKYPVAGTNSCAKKKKKNVHLTTLAAMSRSPEYWPILPPCSGSWPLQPHQQTCAKTVKNRHLLFYPSWSVKSKKQMVPLEGFPRLRSA